MFHTIQQLTLHFMVISWLVDRTSFKFKFHVYCWPSIHRLRNIKLDQSFFLVKLTSHCVSYVWYCSTESNQLWQWSKWVHSIVLVVVLLPRFFYKGPELNIFFIIHWSCLLIKKYDTMFIHCRYNAQHRHRHYSHPATLSMYIIDGSTENTRLCY